jgi:hypothetical protein
MCGQEGYFGTNAFQIVLDIEEMRKLKEIVAYEKYNEEEEINKMFELSNPDDKCSLQKLTIENNVVNIKSQNLGDVNDDYDAGF